MKRTIAIALCSVLLAGNIRFQKQEGANPATPTKYAPDLSAKLTAIEKAVEVITAAHNATFEDAMTSFIFKPLGMHTSNFF